MCVCCGSQESVTTDAECEGLKHVTGGDVLVTGAGWALGREQLNTFAFVKEFRDVSRLSAIRVPCCPCNLSRSFHVSPSNHGVCGWCAG